MAYMSLSPTYTCIAVNAFKGACKQVKLAFFHGGCKRARTRGAMPYHEAKMKSCFQLYLFVLHSEKHIMTELESQPSCQGRGE